MNRPVIGRALCAWRLVAYAAVRPPSTQRPITCAAQPEGRSWHVPRLFRTLSHNRNKRSDSLKTASSQRRTAVRGVSVSTLDSVVKIYAVATAPNYILPWSMKPQKESTGSGFVIEGRRVLTNAHVVANHTAVMVRKHGSPVKYMATVEHAGHECDLATLRIDDNEFWHDLPPLQFGDVPSLQDRVTIIGYPTGGDAISLSAGVISRVEFQQYVHGAAHLPSCQVDAAINPGNSGGPALRDDRVVGVAFQHLPGAESIGYIIPVPVIEHFLEDVRRNGRYTGFSQFGVVCQSLENGQLRCRLGMPAGRTGVRVAKALPLHPSSDVLRPNDVIMEVDGTRVANDGTIAFRNKERINFHYILMDKFIGDSVKLLLWRDRKEATVELALATVPPLVPSHQYDTSPSYLIHAGLVFVPLVQPYLHEWGADWWNTSPRKLSARALFGMRKAHDEEIVILSQILADEANAGYGSATNLELRSLNGTRVVNLKHLASLVTQNTEPYLWFEFEDDVCVCLDRQVAADATARILESHRIPSPMSRDLLAAV